MAGPKHLPRVSVELDPMTYDRFYAMLPKGMPSHLIRCFIQSLIELADRKELLETIEPWITNKQDFDKKGLLQKLVASRAANHE